MSAKRRSHDENEGFEHIPYSAFVPDCRVRQGFTEHRKARRVFFFGEPDRRSCRKRYLSGRTDCPGSATRSTTRTDSRLGNGRKRGKRTPTGSRTSSKRHNAAADKRSAAKEGRVRASVGNHSFTGSIRNRTAHPSGNRGTEAVRTSPADTTIHGAAHRAVL